MVFLLQVSTCERMRAETYVKQAGYNFRFAVMSSFYIFDPFSLERKASSSADWVMDESTKNALRSLRNTLPFFYQTGH